MNHVLNNVVNIVQFYKCFLGFYIIQNPRTVVKYSLYSISYCGISESDFEMRKKVDEYKQNRLIDIT